MEDKIYVRCENCQHWRELVNKSGNSFRKGFCWLWGAIDIFVYSDDYCSKGVGKRK